MYLHSFFASDDSSHETETEEDDSMFLEAVQSPVLDLDRERRQTLTGRRFFSRILQFLPFLEIILNSRRQLPVPKTETEGVNLWNLLCKNIGKDLSKISMPVTLNEPLSTLQRLCEELEYSDLIDKAVLAQTPLERLM